MFCPSRLLLARKRRGLTKLALAKASGVALRTLVAYEGGQRTPIEDNIAALARALRFPVEFFHGDPLELPDTDAASFRALKGMTSGQRDASLAAGALALSLSHWIGQRFDLPNPNLPNLRDQDPELAAQMVRIEWGLGERPVRNMIHLMEAKGVRVFSLPIDSLSVDAFSVWYHGQPFVFLNTRKSSEHSRLDAAHELGHLILHKHGPSRGRDLEQDANRFGSAFLMPYGSILASAPRMPTLGTLIQLKRDWMVSVAALAYRLHSLKLLTDWNYRRLCMAMTKAKYHRCEPEGIQRETSQVLSKVFDMLRAEGITRTHIARDLSLFIEDLDSLTFGLVHLSAIQGGVRGHSRQKRNGDLPPLRLA